MDLGLQTEESKITTVNNSADNTCPSTPGRGSSTMQVQASQNGNEQGHVTTINQQISDSTIHTGVDLTMNMNQHQSSGLQHVGHNSIGLSHQRRADRPKKSFLRRMTTIGSLSQGMSNFYRTSVKETLAMTASSKLVTLIIGDALHNFIDGITIATAFAKSNSMGFGTSFAVLLHELPHELGDFAVYYKLSGSYMRALAYNLFSALFCYAGLFLGFGILNIPGLKDWLLMFAAASFMYITVTHILPEIEIVQTGSTESFELRLFLVIVGLLLGWFSMMLLAIFETEVSQLFA